MGNAQGKPVVFTDEGMLRARYALQLMLSFRQTAWFERLTCSRKLIDSSGHIRITYNLLIL